MRGRSGVEREEGEQGEEVQMDEKRDAYVYRQSKICEIKGVLARYSDLQVYTQLDAL